MAQRQGGAWGQVDQVEQIYEAIFDEERLILRRPRIPAPRCLGFRWTSKCPSCWDHSRAALMERKART